MSTIAYKLDLGLKGAKTAIMETHIDDLDELMEKNNYRGIHEVATGRVIPFFDYDCKVKTLKEFNELRYETIERADSEIRKLFPKAKILFFESSGKSGDKWKIGGHWKVRGHGSYPSSLDIKEFWKRLPEAMRTDKDNGFDGQIYGKDRSLRMPYTAKPSDPERVLKRAEIERESKKITVLRLTDCADVLGESWVDWLHTCVQGEKKRQTLIKEEPKKEKKADDEAANEYPDDTEDTVREWVEALSPARACGEESASHVIWAIADKAKQMGIDLEPLAQEFAKRTTADNYNEVWVTGQYHRARGAITFGSLIRWACEDSPDAAVVKRHLERVEAAKPDDPDMEIPASYYEDKYELLEKNPSVKQVRHWMTGCLAYVQNSSQWYLRFRHKWEKLPQCPKNFPFTTLSESAVVTYTKREKDNKGKEQDTEVEVEFCDILKKLQKDPLFKRCRYIQEACIPYFKVAPEGVFNNFR